MSSILRKEHLLKPRPAATVTMRNAEFGVRSTGDSAIRTPHSALSAVGPVFGINFIRRSQAPLVLRRALVYLASAYLVANVVLLLWLVGLGGATGWRAAALERRLHQTLPSADVVHTMGQEMSALTSNAQAQLAQLTAVAALRRQSFSVAGKLGALTETLPARTWITNLSGARGDRTIQIDAAYLINPEAPYDLPAKAWMAALRADPVFGAGLTRLELGASSRKRQDQAELFVFTLEAQWAAR